MFNRIAVCGLLALSLGACAAATPTTPTTALMDALEPEPGRNKPDLGGWSLVCPQGTRTRESCGLAYGGKGERDAWIRAYIAYSGPNTLSVAFITPPEAQLRNINLRIDEHKLGPLHAGSCTAAECITMWNLRPGEQAMLMHSTSLSVLYSLSRAEGIEFDLPTRRLPNAVALLKSKAR